MTRGFLFVPSIAFVTVATNNGRVPSGTVEIREGTTVVKRLNVVAGHRDRHRPVGQAHVHGDVRPERHREREPEHERTGQYPLTTR